MDKYEYRILLESFKSRKRELEYENQIFSKYGHMIDYKNNLDEIDKIEELGYKFGFDAIDLWVE